MANEGDLKVTKGSTKTYTYYGDSGTSSKSKRLAEYFGHLKLTLINQQASQ